MASTPPPEWPTGQYRPPPRTLWSDLGGVWARFRQLPVALQLVIAAIGLSLGVLDEPMYATIVLIAVLTTVMAAPLLQICVRRAGVAPADEPTPAAPTLPVA